MLLAPPFENVALGALAPDSGAGKKLMLPLSRPAARSPFASSPSETTLPVAVIVKFEVVLLVSGRLNCNICAAALSLPTYKCSGVGVGDGVGDGRDGVGVAGDASCLVNSTKEYVRPATSGYGNAYVVHDTVLPVGVPGPEIVFQPTERSRIVHRDVRVGRVGQRRAARERHREGRRIRAVHADVGRHREVAERVSAVPPIVRAGGASTAPSACRPGASASRHRQVRDHARRRAAAVPVSPGPIGPSETVDDAVVLVVRVPSRSPGSASDWARARRDRTPVLKGGGDEEPPLQPATRPPWTMTRVDEHDRPRP